MYPTVKSMRVAHLTNLLTLLCLLCHTHLYVCQPTTLRQPSDMTPAQDAPTETPPPLSTNTNRGFEYFRVCGVAATGETFRFDLDKTCPSTQDKKHVEGILLVYKINIVPYIFKIRRYRKIITQLTIWRGLTTSSVTGKFEMATQAHEWEVGDFDSIYQCYNSATMVVNNVRQVYVDRDGVNKTVNIRPVDGLTGNIQRYFSQPTLYSEPGWMPGFYRVRTTVNCEIVDMVARSMDPYNYIATALGDSLELSPFQTFDNTSQSTAPKRADMRVREVKNYKFVDYNNRGTAPAGQSRTFLETPSATYSWKTATRQTATCDLVHWKTFPRAIQTAHEHSYHFVANEVTATFNTPLTEVENFTSTYSCVSDQINKTISEYIQKLNNSYVASGKTQYFKTDGNLYLIWQPLEHPEIEDIDEDSDPEPTPAPPKSTRRKREAADNGNSTSEVSKGSENPLITAQIQFAYDKLTTSVNNVLEELSRAWCREQVRDTLMWYELSKVNPTSVMSAIYGKPVAARYVGDAISVTDCIYVDQSSVNIHQSLRLQHDKTTCYSRPRVTFKFINSTDPLTGQLGPRKEIILSNTNIETCKDESEHYFIVGEYIYYYKNYIFEEKLNLSSIATLDTFIALNISFIENIDFKTVELYSSTERKLASSVFDIESMFREYNYYTYSLAGIKKDLDNTIDYNRDRLVQDLSDMMADLGDIGRSVVNVVSSVVTFFSSIVTGFIKFFTNPLGGIFILLIIGGIIFLVVVLNRRNSQFHDAPIKMLYPSVENYAARQAPPPYSASPPAIDKEEIKRILLGMHQVHQEEKEAQKQLTNSGPTLWQKATGFLRNRRKGYSQLPLEDESTSL
ncbi:glycoprotein B [Murine herpesvirus strain 4556]|uniref:8 protein n=3 Tax=Orthoherpesviridae TaxID=3044472 RepID=Q98336_MHV68|nr:glycoprotein B [Murid gammaherpesvirus 4]ABD83812.1 glycoprotein B [Murine herpesvirus strain 72]AXP99067.1 glycoprotein B [synthetic construct]QJQ80202.1 glycoprotein B [Murine herpesvirus]UNZ86716.1 glycoprotein B [Murine herpesvirus strain 4556]AAB06229.1 glycoprotein B precursor homolog [Murid gammaherpesvirus 4]